MIKISEWVISHFISMLAGPSHHWDKAKELKGSIKEQFCHQARYQLIVIEVNQLITCWTALSIFFPKCYLFHSCKLFLQSKLEGCANRGGNKSGHHRPASLNWVFCPSLSGPWEFICIIMLFFKTEEPCNTPASSIEGDVQLTEFARITINMHTMVKRMMNEIMLYAGLYAHC